MVPSEQKPILVSIDQVPEPQQSFILGVVAGMTARKGLEQPTDAQAPA